MQCCSDAGPLSSMVTYFRPASVCHLLVACADHLVRRRVLCYSFASDLCLSRESSLLENMFFLVAN